MIITFNLDFELKKVLLTPPPPRDFCRHILFWRKFQAEFLKDVCTLCSGALVSDSL